MVIYEPSSEERGLRKNQPCWCPDLGLSASRIEGLVAERKSQFIGLLRCLPDMAVGFLQRKWSQHQGGNANVWSSLIAEVTHQDFCQHCWSRKQPWHDEEGDSVRVWTPGAEDSWGPSWRLSGEFIFELTERSPDKWLNQKRLESSWSVLKFVWRN